MQGHSIVQEIEDICDFSGWEGSSGLLLGSAGTLHCPGTLGHICYILQGFRDTEIINQGQAQLGSAGALYCSGTLEDL